MECVNNVVVNNSGCLKPCSGLIVTSFSKSNLNKDLEEMQALSKAYNNYKKITEYPPGYTGRNTFYNFDL